MSPIGDIARHRQYARVMSGKPLVLSGLKSGAMLLADRGFDADWIRAFVSQHGAWANIPPKRNRTEPFCFSRHLYRGRNLVERFFNKKQCRRIGTRYDKLAANYLAFINWHPSGYCCALMSQCPSRLTCRRPFHFNLSLKTVDVTEDRGNSQRTPSQFVSN